MIKIRFAPSPTGELHIGGARTALFGYLFAKHNKGEFLLRIEDTDRERFVEGATERIIESLEWLGLRWDNYSDVMIQSARKEIYKKHALELVEKEAAYVCDCSKERLDALRKTQEQNKLPTGYDGHCRKVESKKLKVERWEDLPEGAVIRLKMPEGGKIVINDLIRGKVEFEAALLDDPIILKSDGFPTYHLAVVVDDHEMGITHVIRAEEWLSSTPKHHTLYEAFGWPEPEFAHLPMILGPDKKKLSKRHGATAALEYKKMGYLPDAIVNFLALLGWNPRASQEINQDLFSLDYLPEVFELEKVNKSPAIFDLAKLGIINEFYLRCKQPNQLKALLADFQMVNLTDGEIALVQRGGFKTLVEIIEYLKKLRKEPEYSAELLVFKKSDREKTSIGLKSTLEKIRGLQGENKGRIRGEQGGGEEGWSVEGLQKVLEEVVAENKLSNGDVFWPVRVALSGEEKSPSPVELLVALDRVESLKRIDGAIKNLTL